MSGDRSLDEFVPGSDTDAGDGSESEQDSPPASETDVDSTAETGEGRETAVDPAESTYAWSPSGATCAACGATVERRWRDGGDLVCADCKSW